MRQGGSHDDTHLRRISAVTRYASHTSDEVPCCASGSLVHLRAKPFSDLSQRGVGTADVSSPVCQQQILNQLRQDDRVTIQQRE